MAILAIWELDLHGMTVHQAQIAIDSRLKQAKAGTYRIRLIHGYHGGTALREFVRKTYRTHPKVIRVEMGLNPGETDLVLREI